MEVIGLHSLVQLLAIGGLLGLGALLWVFVKGRGHDKAHTRYRRLIYLATFLTFDLIMFGSFTRLSDSGLGCPDWPGCYAYATPFHASEHITAAQAALPDGPVTMTKAWIEMLHRYFAMAVGLLLTIIMCMAWRKARRFPAFPLRTQSPWLATCLFLLVCVQGAFGAWTVTLKLQPIIVTIHLLLAMSLLIGLFWLGSWQRKLIIVIHPPWLRYLSRIALFALVIQIALGAWVSTNYAVLACYDFPLCHDQWFPSMNFEQGFTLWRPLGQSATGEMISMEALVAIHWVHRSFAVCLLFILGPMIYTAYKILALRRLVIWFSLMLLLQIATGISNIVLQWPLWGALIHSGGAAALLFLLVNINHHLRAFSADDKDQVFDPTLDCRV